MLRLSICLLALPCALAALAAPAQLRLALPTTWRVQPATQPDVPPADTAWESFPGVDWRWGSGGPRGSSWEKVDRKTVHALWYEQTFTLPPDMPGNRLFLDFRRIEGDAVVFLNDRKIGELLRPGGEIEITPAVAWDGDNRLRVFLTRNYAGISRNFAADPLRYLTRNERIPMANWPLGITAPVTLLSRPRPAGIADVFLLPSWREKTLTVEVEIDAAEAADDLGAEAEIRDAAGKVALTIPLTALRVPAGHSTQRIAAPWTNPTLWELDRGYLYTAQVRLTRAGAVVDAYPPVSFGFREIWVDGRQIMMNGHPSHWRYAMLCGINAPAVSFFRQLGYNVAQIQPNPTTWWADWAETPLYDEAMLATMDAAGCGATMPAPGISYIRSALLTDDRVQRDFDREMRLYLKRYRNHPSILAWAVGMNTYCPPRNIHADGMGQKPEGPEPLQAQTINAACAAAKKYDATRPAYSHADGCTGDLSTSNVYLNFIPLQEREEWPMAWAERGNMPYMAAEFGQPYTANFWKGTQFLLTEYLAMYFGDHAYASEGEAGLRKTVEYGKANTSGHGAMLSVDLAQYPDYWEFQRLFVRQTNRAWRTWGVGGGWLYWNLDTAYGDPPGFDVKKNAIYNRYSFITEPVTGKPAWVNPNFDIHRQANQSLLVYIGGAPRHTDKTHAYFAGERLRKQIVAIWDGAGERRLEAAWALQDGAGKPVTTGKASLTLNTGDITLVPFECAAPNVTVRSTYTLALTVRDGAEVVASDRFPLQVFPAVTPAKVAGKVAVYDPAGKTAPWLAKLGVTATPWKPGDALHGIELLVIGREALRPGEKIPYTPADIRRGLRVLILEQQPDVWEGVGFRAIETMPRYVFPRVAGTPVLTGLQPEDLINWRGVPNLWPEGKLPRAHDVRHAPKWTNTHAVASVALQIPEVAGFTPLLACEFDLNFSPLLRWQDGAGAVYYATLDFTGRVGSDPAATLLARNLLAEALRKPAATRKVVYVGGPGGRALLERLQVAISGDGVLRDPAATLLVVGEAANAGPAELNAFVQAGGQVLVLPQSAEALRAWGYATATKSMARASTVASPRFAGIGPSLLRWRVPLEVTAFTPEGQPAGAQVVADGAGLIRPQGNGTWLFLQVSPDLLLARSPAEGEQATQATLSVARLSQLTAQLLSNLGATPSVAQGERLTTLKLGLAYETLGHWQVLGPFPVAKDDGDLMLGTKFPGEEDAIAGDTNPNTVYTRADGARLDWRKTATAHPETGFVDLGAALHANELAVAYVSRIVRSDTARTARLRLGMDYRLQVWLNGQPVYRMAGGHGTPSPNRFLVDLPLKKGDNVLTIKVGSGSKGFGFWANLSTPGVDVTAPRDPAARGAVLYGPQLPGFDPYEYFYW